MPVTERDSFGSQDYPHSAGMGQVRSLPQSPSSLVPRAPFLGWASGGRRPWLVVPSPVGLGRSGLRGGSPSPRAVALAFSYGLLPGGRHFFDC